MPTHPETEHAGTRDRGTGDRGASPGWHRATAGLAGGRPEIWSHRGRLEGPDDPANTEAALRAAAAAGVDGVEIDVRRTEDDELVLAHDSLVAGVGPIEHCGFRDLNGRVARLVDAYRAFPTGVVNVELKASGDAASDRRLGRLAADFLRRPERARRTVVSSFSPTLLEALPGNVARALLSRLWPRADVAAWLNRSEIGGLHLGHEGSGRPMPAPLRRWFTAGTEKWIALWTPNTDDELERALSVSYPLRALITDRPLAARTLANETATPPPGRPPGRGRGPCLTRRPSRPERHTSANSRAHDRGKHNGRTVRDRGAGMMGGVRKRKARQ